MSETKAQARPLPTDVETARNSTAETEAPTFDQQCDRVFHTVVRQPLQRELMVEILRFCQQTQLQSNVEQHILDDVHYADALVSPYRMMQELVAAGGLAVQELDEDGNPVSEEDKAGLTEDQVDDLVWDFSYATTPAGAHVVDYYSPQHQMARLMDLHPDAGEAFCRILSYCTQPKTRGELEQFINSNDLARFLHCSSTPRPSVFMDRLETAGLLVWKNGWKTSDAGRWYVDNAAATA